MTDSTTGRGNFTPRAFTYKGVDGKEYTWAGRGRFPKELEAAKEAEAKAGLTTLVDALEAHKKNKPTGNPVGRPKGSTNAPKADKSDIKALAAETVALAPDAN
jgi:hypothetical protein